MSKDVGIRGLKQVMANIRRETELRKRRFLIGLTRGAAVIFRASQQLVPIDTGNLRASGYVRQTGTAVHPVIAIGYTASYAIFVHENLQALHGEAFNRAYAKQLARAKKRRRAGVLPASSPYRHNRAPAQQAKFLEHPFRTLRMPIINAIRQYVATGVWQTPSDTWWKKR